MGIFQREASDYFCPFSADVWDAVWCKSLTEVSECFATFGTCG